MKTIRCAKRVWHYSAFVAAVGLVMTGCGRGDAPNKTDSTTSTVSQTRLPDAYEHFLYLRHDLADGGVSFTDSVVMVRVTRDGFESRPVFSERSLDISWKALGVCNGKLYAVRMGALISVDLETGTAAEIEGEWKIGSCTWSDGKIYAFMQASSLLRVYDAETEAYRDIGVPPHPPEGILWESWPPKLQVSHDHKWLAYFLRSTNFTNSYIHQLCLVTVDDGTVKTSKISVAAREFMTGGSFGKVSDGPPFCWLDSKTLLIVRDISTNHFSFSWGGPNEGPADMILARVDVDADRITDICRLPLFRPQMGEPFFRIGQKGEAPRLVIGRLGQYRIDLVERRLVKDADIGGGYSYTMGKSRDEADELRFKDKLLESGMVIQEIAASPDGRQVAWHARPLVRPSWDADASKIRFHDTVSGETRTVAPGEWIPDAWNDTRPSFEGNLLWVSTRDLTTRSQTNAPAGWKPFSPQPHPGRGQSRRDLR